ncbi:MAG: acyl carrier protein [Burkholderiales bacterium]|nr:acyl carrier protein [Burkholderiales bacterium]
MTRFRPGPLLGAIAAAGVLLVYALLAHRFTITDDRSLAGYLWAAGSIGAMAAAAGWATRWRWPLLALIVLALAAGWQLRTQLTLDPKWFYLAQHAGINALLGLLFGRSLLRGRQPLVTRLALLLHQQLPAPMLAYTRSVTRAWTLFFAAMTLVSLSLYQFGPMAWWSVLANFLTLPAVALMFAVEYAIRLQRFPDFAHASLLDGIRAFNRQR